jgi:hypothetical protein
MKFDWWLLKLYSKSSIKLTGNLKDVRSENYPYLDTFRYLDTENNVLCNMYTEEDEENKSKIVLLSRTDGEYNTLN